MNKKIIIGLVAVVILAVGAFRYFSRPDAPAAEEIAGKAAAVDSSAAPVSHAKPLPEGCATVECKGIKGHVSKLDALLHSPVGDGKAKQP